MDTTTKRLVRKWTKTKAWQQLVLDVLEEQPFCIYCEASGGIEPAAVIDHIRPHRGNDKLFWDRNNLQPLCVCCHGSKSQHERFSDEPYQPSGCDLDGTPRALKIASDPGPGRRVGSVAYGVQDDGG